MMIPALPLPRTAMHCPAPRGERVNREVNRTGLGLALPHRPHRHGECEREGGLAVLQEQGHNSGAERGWAAAIPRPGRPGREAGSLSGRGVEPPRFTFAPPAASRLLSPRGSSLM